MKKCHYEGPLLKFVGGPGVPLLNFEGDPGVPLLNFSGSRVPLLNFEGGPGSRGPGPTLTPCRTQSHKSTPYNFNFSLHELLAIIIASFKLTTVRSYFTLLENK